MKELKFPKLIKRLTWEGYRLKDIYKFLGPLYSTKFNDWFGGQTGVIDGKEGFCVYAYDFSKFLNFIGISVGGIK